MKKIILCAILVFSSTVYAESPVLIDRQTGKYLGNLNNNRFDPNSVSNPYGRYGSKFSQESINNEFGRYGSKFSNDSANNPYSTNAPAVYGDD